MSENDTMFNERYRRCVAVQLMLSTDPSYYNRTIASTLKMQIRTVQRLSSQLHEVFRHGYGFWYLSQGWSKERNPNQVMATRYSISALAFPCVAMLYLISQMFGSITSAAASKRIAMLGNANCTLGLNCMADRKDTDKFYRLVKIAKTIMEVTRPSINTRLHNSSSSSSGNNNNYNSRRDRNVLYPETPVNTTNSSIMLFRMGRQIYAREEVNSAVLKIYIKTKGKRRRRRRIILHVSENTEDGQLTEFATIKLRVKHKGWQKINLPVYLLNKLQHQPISLHVACEKCNKKVRVVLPLKKTKKSQEFRDLGSRKRRSPIIVLNTKPNRAAAAAATAAAAAAVAAAVAPRHHRRPRRDIFGFNPMEHLLYPDSAVRPVQPMVANVNIGSLSSSQGRHVNPNDSNRSASKSLVPARQKEQRFKTSDNTLHKTPVTIRDVKRGAPANKNKDRKKSSFRNDFDYGVGDDDGDDDDGEDKDYIESSSFEYHDDDDDDFIDDDGEDVEDDDEANSSEYDDNRTENVDATLDKTCCMTSRFVSFESIGLSGLVVRPRLGFVSNQCSDICLTDPTHATLLKKAYLSNRDTVNKTKETVTSLRNNPQEYVDQKETSSDMSVKDSQGLQDKPEDESYYQPVEKTQVRSTLPVSSHLRRTKRQNNLRDQSTKGIHVHPNSYSQWQHRSNNGPNETGNNFRRAGRNRTTNKNVKQNHDMERNRLRAQKSCRPVEYKPLNLSFITADLKIEKMTLPDAIVSKCGTI